MNNVIIKPIPEVIVTATDYTVQASDVRLGQILFDASSGSNPAVVFGPTFSVDLFNTLTPSQRVLGATIRLKVDIVRNGGNIHPNCLDPNIDTSRCGGMHATILYGGFFVEFILTGKVPITWIVYDVNLPG